ncbi:MAG: hypothetical protein DRN49_03855 [Thaumarchaeota archaeon]|nr:MAG: hypothetical protein DRN49_03855 [Nitrososphaerota archaeon]
MGKIESLAKAVTLLMNAPLLAAATFVYIYLMDSAGPAPSVLAAALFFSSVLPVVIIFSQRRGGIVTDMMVNEREERTKPFLGAISSYVLGTLALTYLEAPAVMVYLMACYLVNSLFMMIISLRYKISIHASGVAGPATFLVHQYGVRLWPFTLVLVVVGWARLQLRMHTLGQVAWGALLTVLLTLTQLELYPMLIHPL